MRARGPYGTPVFPSEFSAKRHMGVYHFVASVGGSIKQGEKIGYDQAFDQTSYFEVNRITCLCPETCVLRIEEGTELIHTIAEGKEYSSNVSIYIKRMNQIYANIITLAKEQPIIVRFEGNLYPADLLKGLQ